MFFDFNLNYDPCQRLKIVLQTLIQSVVSELLQCPSFVKTNLDKSSTVVVEVASFVANPVALLLNCFVWLADRVKTTNKIQKCNSSLTQFMRLPMLFKI